MNKSNSILITPGDFAGIGPEVALKALANFKSKFSFKLLGPKPLWKKTADSLNISLNFDFIDVPALNKFNAADFSFGKPNPALGKIAMETIRHAATLCLKKKAAAVVTAPLTKSGIHLAGYNYQGHTDFLADISNSKKHAMMLSAGNLRVLLVTHHQSVLSVPSSLSIEKITEKIELAHACGLKLNINNPKIAVCALNPHAGENGAFGSEEINTISPAINAAKNRGFNANGPFPADTLFYRAENGEFDFVIAMYHDQGLIPVKLIGFENGVNTTLGLPFVRTSPDHGSAYDIAGKAIANPSSMRAAIDMAIKLIN